MEYFAHIEKNGEKIERQQTVAQHCRAAADRAGACLAGASLSEVGYLAALLHDVGKCKEEFQTYLLSGEGKRGSVNHSFAGVHMIWERFHGEKSATPSDASAELLAFAIGAHHGLFDCVSDLGESGFAHRVEKQGVFYEESRDGFLSQCANWHEIDSRFSAADAQLQTLYKKLIEMDCSIQQ